MSQNPTTNLFLPVIARDEPGEVITIINATREEAEDFVTAFDKRIADNRKLKSYPNAVPQKMEFYEGANLGLKSILESDLENEETKLNELVERLSVSHIPGFRGRRAVFIDIQNEVIGVGTTVIYNRNWATNGVLDNSVLKTILDAVEEVADAA